jgi:ATP phosphoribosyltransferase
MEDIMQSSENEYLTIALPKGKLFPLAVDLFREAGISADGLTDSSRKLVITNEAQKVKFIISKTADVPTYVEYGAADIGIIGKDVLVESGQDVYELLDLGFGKCRFALAVREGADFYQSYKTRTIASKYPNVARRFFAAKGMDVDIIKIEGSVELAPILGLADGIVDIVETGATLKANGLVPIETVAPVSARLIVNTASMKLYKNEILEFISRCERESGEAEK